MKYILVLMITLLLASTAFGAVGEQLTIGASTPVRFTQQLILDPAHPAISAYCTLDSGSMRFWLNGQAPSASAGHLFSTANNPLAIKGQANLLGFRVISTSGTITLNCTYFSNQ